MLSHYRYLPDAIQVNSGRIAQKPYRCFCAPCFAEKFPCGSGKVVGAERIEAFSPLFHAQGQLTDGLRKKTAHFAAIAETVALLCAQLFGRSRRDPASRPEADSHSPARGRQKYRTARIRVGKGRRSRVQCGLEARVLAEQRICLVGIGGKDDRRFRTQPMWRTSALTASRHRSPHRRGKLMSAPASSIIRRRERVQKLGDHEVSRAHIASNELLASNASTKAPPLTAFLRAGRAAAGRSCRCPARRRKYQIAAARRRGSSAPGTPVLQVGYGDNAARNASLTSRKPISFSSLWGGILHRDLIVCKQIFGKVGAGVCRVPRRRDAEAEQKIPRRNIMRRAGVQDG